MKDLLSKHTLLTIKLKGYEVNHDFKLSCINF